MAKLPSDGLKGGGLQLSMLATMLAMKNNLTTYPFCFQAQPLFDKHRIFDDPNVITLKEDEYKVWEEKWDEKRNKYVEWKEGWDKRRGVGD